MSLFSKKRDNYIENLNSFEEVSKYLNFKNREIKLENITPQTANNIDTLIRFWNIEDEDSKKSFPEREPIKIYINSLGGSLDAALTIIDSITMSRTPVYTFNIGVVYKESFLIYLAGHKRLSYINSIFMYSDNILNRNVEDSNLNDSSFFNVNLTWNKIVKNIKTFFLERVNISEAQYDKHSKKEWWFSSDDALKLHICSEISRRHFHYVKSKN